jgi:6-phosphogluconolactonase
MTAYRYDAKKGTLTELQTLSTLPADFKGYSSCAEVQIAPSGRFLYGSNRGHDSIAIYAINPKRGTLTPVGHESTRGRIPRNFVVDPSGKFLAAANQDTNNIIMFRIDQKTGKLAPTGDVAEAGTPICVRFL